MKENKLVSLDIETSGTDPERHQILSIGLVRLDDLSERYYEVKWGEVVAVPEAFRVNRFDATQLDQQGVSVKHIKGDIAKWFGEQRFTPFGMNVAAFDMRFVYNTLGEGFCKKYFGRRSMDLNALLFAVCYKHDIDFHTLKEESYKKADEIVTERKPHLKPHHALYDAWRNIEVFKLLVQKV
ncbi:MAG: 3'-5' exoribonuclease [Candidatus Blackburnbacteria bacterium]|nr:3'-5' exoribonuclease [Candidatus Blackburnbacteria bacterium]